ncbi:hypothetical protein A9507_15125 [Methanobacterium sp. A39]|uniref:Uncharacterized protein n=1 Tax=Methanobacterium bryantii TaxID=2161 RepID=A0A2A2H4G7_METBR|nr:hypothetical protein A9507_15125 [Methanobacterium sp. A39]PAV04298.1 hypothetical protein ASJ80_05470 [Methanobacterium bryantii]
MNFWNIRKSQISDAPNTQCSRAPNMKYLEVEGNSERISGTPNMKYLEVEGNSQKPTVFGS